MKILATYSFKRSPKQLYRTGLLLLAISFAARYFSQNANGAFSNFFMGFTLGLGLCFLAVGIHKIAKNKISIKEQNK